MKTLSINFSGRGTHAQAIELEAKLATTADPGERTVLQAALAVTLIEVDARRARALVAGLLTHTARHGPARARAAALVAAGLVHSGPEHASLRAKRAQQALDICTSTGERGLAEAAWFLLLGALAELGDFARIDRELSPKLTSAGPFHELIEGRHATWIRTMRATADGRAKDAQSLAGLGYRQALAAQDPDADTVLRGQMAVIRWLQGSASELIEPLLDARQRFPGEPVWQAALAWVWFGQGSLAPATQMLHELDPLTEMPRDRNWLAAAAITADVAAEAGALQQVEALYEALAPFSNRLAVIGHGVTSWGTVARPLARLARRLGDDAAAESYLREAVATSARLGAQAWLAEAQLDLASLLAAGGGSVSEASLLAREASITAGRIGLRSVDDTARQLLRKLRAGPVGATVAATEVAGDVPRQAPRVWALGRFRVEALNGEPVTWRSRKAELLLKVLIARRGALIPREELMDMLWPGIDAAVLSNRFTVALSTARRALDPERKFAHDQFIELGSGLLRARFDRLDCDSARFTERAAREHRESTARLATGTAASLAQCAAVWQTLQLAEEEAFAGERDALWAEPMRHEIDAIVSDLSHLLARELRALGEWARAAQLYRRLLAIDVYDEPAHAGLVECLTGQGAHGQARAAAERARLVLDEIGVRPGDADEIR
ncbi:AfsR/SARP family transcriptional regulator [Leucobacter sp. HY1910]